MTSQFDLYKAINAESGVGYYVYPEAVVIRVSGPDAARYLQGRITQDIKNLQDGACAESLLLSPQGKIQGIFTVIKSADCFFLAARRAYPGAEELIKSLLQFKVADQLEAEVVPWSLLALVGPGRPETANRLAAEPAYLCAASEILCETSRLEQLKAKLEADSVKQCSPEVFEMFRIDAGMPLAGIDISEKNAAPDLELAPLVSFKKGCYTGQEVVEMSIARGKPNKQLVNLRGSASEIPQTPAQLTVPTDGSRAGSLTSAALYPNEPTLRGLGFVKSSALSSPELSAGALSLSISQ